MVYAQPAPVPAEPPNEPWKVGISAETMVAAQELTDQATDLFVERHYPEALDKYRAALALWDHPALRFDIARCLVALDRPVEAADNLERALVYGQGPLSDELYADALEYRKLLANQIGEVEVRCTEPAVAITIDGHDLGTCPLDRTTRVIPGDHQIVGRKPGYLTETKQQGVYGGKHVAVVIAPVPLVRAGVEVRRWPVVVPWLVVGGGVVVAGVGGLLRAAASSDMAAYNAEVRRDCHDTGCTADQLDLRLRDHAVHLNIAAIATGAVGIAAVVTGGVLVYANRTHTLYPTLELEPAGATLGVRGAF